MSFVKLNGIIIAATLILAALTIPFTYPYLTRMSFTGTVYAQGTVPIAGTTVVASGSNGTGFATTDSNGRYQIVEGLATGEYSVTVMSAKGYVDKRVDKIKIVSGQETSGINFLLRRSGAISGKVIAPDNKPLKGILVYANAVGRGGNASSYALTVDDGSYNIYTGLSTGTYNVTAGWNVLGSLGETVGYIPNIKPNINVVEVQETSRVDFQLQISGMISGKVATSGGTPLVGLMVSATSSDGKYVGFAYSSSGGIYKIASGLGTGSYNVFVLKGMLPVFKTGISVTAGQETPNIDFQVSIPSSGSISGRLTDTAGNPIVSASVSASGPAGLGEAKTDMFGYYAISEGLGTGDYNVLASASGYAASSISNVHVTVNQETKGINFQLQKTSGLASGKISGQVTGEANPIPEFPVIVVPVVFSLATLIALLASLKIRRIKIIA